MPVDEAYDKWACEPCVRGHRSTKCTHITRLMIRVRKPGRPLTTCPHPNTNTCSCRKERVFMVKIRDDGPDGQCVCRVARLLDENDNPIGPPIDTSRPQQNGQPYVYLEEPRQQQQQPPPLPQPSELNMSRQPSTYGGMAPPGYAPFDHMVAPHLQPQAGYPCGVQPQYSYHGGFPQTAPQPPPQVAFDSGPHRCCEPPQDGSTPDSPTEAARCQCGDACNCRFCPVHPQNSASHAAIRDIFEDLENHSGDGHAYVPTANNGSTFVVEGPNIPYAEHNDFNAPGSWRYSEYHLHASFDPTLYPGQPGQYHDNIDPDLTTFGNGHNMSFPGSDYNHMLMPDNRVNGHMMPENGFNGHAMLAPTGFSTMHHGLPGPLNGQQMPINGMHMHHMAPFPSQMGVHDAHHMTNGFSHTAPQNPSYMPLTAPTNGHGTPAPMTNGTSVPKGRAKPAEEKRTQSSSSPKERKPKLSAKKSCCAKK